MSSASPIDALGPRELPDVQLVLQADRAGLTAKLHAEQVACAVTGSSDGWAVVRLAATVDPAPHAVTLAAAFSSPVLVGCAALDEDVLGLLLLIDERSDPTAFFLQTRTRTRTRTSSRCRLGPRRQISRSGCFDRAVRPSGSLPADSPTATSRSGPGSSNRAGSPTSTR